MRPMRETKNTCTNKQRQGKLKQIRSQTRVDPASSFLRALRGLEYVFIFVGVFQSANMTQAEKVQDNGKDKDKEKEKEQQRGVKRPITPAAIPEPLHEVRSELKPSVDTVIGY